MRRQLIFYIPGACSITRSKPKVPYSVQSGKIASPSPKKRIVKYPVFVSALIKFNLEEKGEENVCGGWGGGVVVNINLKYKHSIPYRITDSGWYVSDTYSKEV